MGQQLPANRHKTQRIITKNRVNLTQIIRGQNAWESTTNFPRKSPQYIFQHTDSILYPISFTRWYVLLLLSVDHTTEHYTYCVWFQSRARYSPHIAYRCTLPSSCRNPAANDVLSLPFLSLVNTCSLSCLLKHTDPFLLAQTLFRCLFVDISSHIFHPHTKIPWTPHTTLSRTATTLFTALPACVLHMLYVVVDVGVVCGVLPDVCADESREQREGAGTGLCFYAPDGWRTDRQAIRVDGLRSTGTKIVNITYHTLRPRLIR